MIGELLHLLLSRLAFGLGQASNARQELVLPRLKICRNLIKLDLVVGFKLLKLPRVSLFPLLVRLQQFLLPERCVLLRLRRFPHLGTAIVITDQLPDAALVFGLGRISSQDLVPVGCDQLLFIDLAQVRALRLADISLALLRDLGVLLPKVRGKTLPFLFRDGTPAHRLALPSLLRFAGLSPRLEILVVGDEPLERLAVLALRRRVVDAFRPRLGIARVDLRVVGQLRSAVRIAALLV